MCSFYYKKQNKTFFRLIAAAHLTATTGLENIGITSHYITFVVIRTGAGLQSWAASCITSWKNFTQ